MLGTEARVTSPMRLVMMGTGRFAVPAPHLSAGIHRLFAAIFLDGNAIEPSVGSIVLEGN